MILALSVALAVAAAVCALALALPCPACVRRRERLEAAYRAWRDRKSH
jgi:ABC-type Fe3+ transport system permease subunit